MYKIFDTVDEVSRYTTQRLLDKIRTQPTATLGLATGSTMEPVYAQLLASLHNSPLNVSKLTTFNLDEYIGLSADHPQSYNYYMHQHLFNQLDIPEESIHLPDGLTDNIDSACQCYSNAIKDKGGLDLQLLGIGTNGHIGFNEPLTSFNSRTHVVELSEQTRIDNSRFFNNKAEMPTHALTMGILDILEAKEIILVATGKHKAQVMAQLFHSSIDESLPASALKKHNNLTIVLDREAATLLPEQVCKNAV
ncbi:glucosamine-6-phosphate deaminase [Denitrificimonas sp. JX-1]|uniref:Glucosamine-6-phosphate deaminase n=1 Tax=Denitrificimonas halotolerans TaxID=3098930 RepID=A0ABU5GQN5_9GAMM|nr:glucosamine-6-phosphate deaminase [Denitrificimonas sp. JX-1]MDY7218685.1 glucosamine-6-phosphate deaminase [Denitrificimonas sp. JX-1]